MCAPSPPAAPDYQAAAQQQGQANAEAARIQGKINNPNVISPYGTQNVTWSQKLDQEGYNAALQKAKQGLIPYPNQRDFVHDDQPTLNQTLSPSQQGLYDLSVSTQQKLGGLAGQGADALKGVVGTGVDFSGAPTTGSYDATRKSVIDAMMGRANEDYAKQTDQSNSDLIAAGIRPGTKAYADRQQMIERSHNDARSAAEVAGGNAASQAYGMDADRRRQYITELLAKRQTPLNEITALMSGSQVSNPFTAPGYAQNASVQPAPLFGATREAGDYATDLYNVRSANANNLQSGLFGLAGAGIQGAASGGAAKSDRRLKSNIVRIGTHPLGIGLYEYDLDGTRQRGVMADEVLTVRPQAVLQHPDGYLMVDYGQLN